MKREASISCILMQSATLLSDNLYSRSKYNFVSYFIFFFFFCFLFAVYECAIINGSVSIMTAILKSGGEYIWNIDLYELMSIYPVFFLLNTLNISRTEQILSHMATMYSNAETISFFIQNIFIL